MPRWLFRTSGGTAFGGNPLRGSFGAGFASSRSTQHHRLVPGRLRSPVHLEEIRPVQVFRQASTEGENFDRDVVARFKVRCFGGINALDHRFVMKMEGE